MTGQREPNPDNRFETWADGTTPSGHQQPRRDESGESAWEPPSWTPQSSAPEPSPPHGGQSFPTYPYAAPPPTSGDPRQDEAYNAFQGYQAGTGSPHQAMQPYQAYQPPYNYARHPYRTTGPNASYAVPSLVLGIVSVFCGGVTGPIGLGFGIAALKQIQSDPRLGGRGLAVAGIATSAFGTFFLLMIILGVIAS